MHKSSRKRGQPLILFFSTLVALLVASAPLSVPAIADWRHETRVNDIVYKQANGHWEIVDLPPDFKLNTVHASLLHTGKVLLVAGSGNNRENFNAYHDNKAISVLKTALYDPETQAVKMIPTPSDLFCSGHALLQDGNLLIAGGTSGYELLESDVTKPAGAMIIHNENPHDVVRLLKAGTKFTSPTGKAYASTQDVTVQPATKMDHGEGDVMITHSSTTVFVEAIDASSAALTDRYLHYNIEGLTADESHDLYGQGGAMTLSKQDFRGDNKSYEFDPVTEKYIKTGDLNQSRWYPSLPVLTNGHVLAVSGLDNTGIITKTTENFDPITKVWSPGPEQALPTYPALFRTANPDVLFYSASSAGYGPENVGRQPGFWNIITNQFSPVPGLRDSDLTETSASVFLPPAMGSNDGVQSSTVMIAGGGGVGESDRSSARSDIIDIAAGDPHYVPGPDLPDSLRYLNLTVLPSDQIFAAGGTRDYRAKQNSYSFKSFMIEPGATSVKPMADELVGRGYHSGSLLLPNGKVLVFGNDPLYSDKDNTMSGKFEQRLELYTPPQLYKSAQPKLSKIENAEVQRGQTLTFKTSDATSIKTARLIPPSTTTHVTNVEQRSVAAVVKTDAQNGQISISIPLDEAILPNGWYMLFVTNTNGTPSRAQMIHIGA